MVYYNNAQTYIYIYNENENEIKTRRKANETTNENCKRAGNYHVQAMKLEPNEELQMQPQFGWRGEKDGRETELVNEKEK